MIIGTVKLKALWHQCIFKIQEKYQAPHVKVYLVVTAAKKGIVILNKFNFNFLTTFILWLIQLCLSKRAHSDLAEGLSTRQGLADFNLSLRDGCILAFGNVSILDCTYFDNTSIYFSTTVSATKKVSFSINIFRIWRDFDCLVTKNIVFLEDQVKLCYCSKRNNKILHNLQ